MQLAIGSTIGQMSNKQIKSVHKKNHNQTIGADSVALLFNQKDPF